MWPPEKLDAQMTANAQLGFLKFPWLGANHALRRGGRLTLARMTRTESNSNQGLFYGLSPATATAKISASAYTSVLLTRWNELVSTIAA
jgi:hypothetical protein